MFPVEGGEEGNWALNTMVVWGCEGSDRRAGRGMVLGSGGVEEVAVLEADEGTGVGLVAGVGLMVIAVTMMGGCS
jgi:hypothetical protein